MKVIKYVWAGSPEDALHAVEQYSEYGGTYDTLEEAQQEPIEKAKLFVITIDISELIEAQ